MAGKTGPAVRKELDWSAAGVRGLPDQVSGSKPKCDKSVSESEGPESTSGLRNLPR